MFADLLTALVDIVNMTPGNVEKADVSVDAVRFPSSTSITTAKSEENMLQSIKHFLSSGLTVSLFLAAPLGQAGSAGQPVGPAASDAYTAPAHCQTAALDTRIQVAAKNNPKCDYLQKCCKGDTDGKKKCCDGFGKECLGGGEPPDGGTPAPTKGKGKRIPEKS